MVLTGGPCGGKTTGQAKMATFFWKSRLVSVPLHRKWHFQKKLPIWLVQLSFLYRDLLSTPICIPSEKDELPAKYLCTMFLFMKLKISLKYIIRLYNIKDFIKLFKCSLTLGTLHTLYRLFFLTSIAQFFTKIYINCFVSS